MEKYSLWTDCIKCGGGDRAAGRYWQSRGYYSTSCEVHGRVADIIRRTCRYCGYHWHELPLDAEEEKKPEKERKRTFWERLREPTDGLGF